MKWLIMIPLGFMFGLVTLLTGWLAAGFLNLEWRQTLGDVYLNMAAVAMDRPTIAARSYGALDMVARQYDNQKNADEVTLDGDTAHLPDGLQTSGQLRQGSKTFALAMDRPGIMTSPLWAEVGKQFARMRKGAQLQETVTLGEGENATTVPVKSDYIPLDPSPTMVNLRDTAGVLAGSYEPSNAEDGYTYGQKSQEGFTEAISTKQALIIGGMFAVGGLMVFVIARYGGGGGGGTPDVGSVLPGMVQALGVMT